MSIHNIHAASEAYSKASADYTEGRPDYPEEARKWLHEDLEIRRATTVLELGAGTGKFTVNIIETGAKVIAMVPIPEMLAILSSSFPHVQAILGAAETIPLLSETVDVVICAQSFHWFSNEQSLSEIYRVLKPGGKLGLIWNMRDRRIGWVRKLNQIVDAHEGDAPRFYSSEWQKVFPFKGFSSLRKNYFSHAHEGSPEDVLIRRVKSTSFIAALPPEKAEAVESQVRELIQSEMALKDKAHIRVPYFTNAYTAIKHINQN